MRRLAVDTSTPTVIASSSQVHCNNDHGLSPDGTLLAISDQSANDHASHIYTLPAAGGTPHQIVNGGWPIVLARLVS